MTIEPNRTEDKPEAGKPAGKREGSENRPPPGDGLALLKQQHRAIEAAFGDGAKGDAAARLAALARAWLVHAGIEAELILPAIAPPVASGIAFQSAAIRTDIVNLVLAEAMRDGADAEALEARLAVIETELKAMMEAEEKSGDGLYALAAKAGVDFAALAPRIAARTEELQKAAEDKELQPPDPRSLRLRVSGRPNLTEENQTMARRDMPERDERGRFVSDDEDRSRGRYARDDEGRFSSGGRYARDRDEEGRFTSRNGGGRYGRDRDEEGRFTSGNGGGRYERDRDEEGRFTSSRYGRSRDDDRDYGRGSQPMRRDEDRRYASRDYDDDRRYARSREEDDDRAYGRDRGHGGWYGDSEAHARAAREGWERRRDNDGQYGRSHDDDDDGYGRDMRSMRRDDDDRRSQSRSDRDYDDDRRHARSRDDDDDGRYARDRGQGGWFGDSEGHSRASRRGWEGRR